MKNQEQQSQEPIFAQDIEEPLTLITKVGQRVASFLAKPNIQAVVGAFESTYQLIKTGGEGIIESAVNTFDQEPNSQPNISKSILTIRKESKTDTNLELNMELNMELNDKTNLKVFDKDEERFNKINQINSKKTFGSQSNDYSDDNSTNSKKTQVSTNLFSNLVVSLRDNLNRSNKK